MPGQENPGLASGDRLHFPGVWTLGDRSHTYPGLVSTFHKASLANLWNNLQLSHRKNTCCYEVSCQEESTDLLLVAAISNTGKPIGRYNVFLHILPTTRIVKFGCTGRLSEIVQEPPKSERRACSSSPKIVEVLLRRITKFSAKNTNLQHRCASVVQDLFSYLRKASQRTSKTAQGTRKCLQQGLIIQAIPWNLFPLVKMNVGITTGQRPTDQKTKALPNTQFAGSTDGTEKWWRETMECFCYLRYIPDKLADRKSPYETRFGTPSDGSVIPFGAAISFNPIFTKDNCRLHQFGTKMDPGIFNRHALNSGGGWTRGMIIADWHNIENNVASDVHVKRFKSREVGLKKLQ